MLKAAEISEDGMYRYSLTRIWDGDLPRVCFIMLNPSTADAEVEKEEEGRAYFQELADREEGE